VAREVLVEALSRVSADHRTVVLRAVVAHILTGLPGMRITTGSHPVARHGDDEETRAL